MFVVYATIPTPSFSRILFVADQTNQHPKRIDGQDVVGNLVVITTLQAGFLQVIPGEDMMDVSLMGNQVVHGNVAGLLSESIRSRTLVASHTNGRCISGMAISPELTQARMVSIRCWFTEYF